MTAKLVTPLALIIFAGMRQDAAHAILIDGTPAIHASIPAGHAAMMLKFNSCIDRERSRLTLVGTDNSETRMPIDKAGPPDVMTTAGWVWPVCFSICGAVLLIYREA